MRDIQLVLERWGAWASQGNTHIGYSTIAAGFKGLLPETKRSRLSCCDNDGMIIDSAIARLQRVHDEQEVGVIMLHYFYNVSKSEIARRWRCSEGHVRQKLLLAESFIEGCLAITGAKLEMDAWSYKSEISSVA